MVAAAAGHRRVSAITAADCRALNAAALLACYPRRPGLTTTRHCPIRSLAGAQPPRKLAGQTGQVCDLAVNLGDLTYIHQIDFFAGGW